MMTIMLLLLLIMMRIWWRGWPLHTVPPSPSSPGTRPALLHLHLGDDLPPVPAFTSLLKQPGIKPMTYLLGSKEGRPACQGEGPSYQSDPLDIDHTGAPTPRFIRVPTVQCERHSLTLHNTLLANWSKIDQTNICCSRKQPKTPCGRNKSRWFPPKTQPSRWKCNNSRKTQKSLSLQRALKEDSTRNYLIYISFDNN